jgi:hypothetical protein
MALKIFKKVKEKVKDIKEKGKSTKEKIVGKTSFIVLLPLVPAMKIILLAKGYTPASSNIETIATMFYKHIVKGEAYQGVNHYEHNEAPDIEGGGDSKADIISTIISGIVSYFKKLKDRKNKGGDLSATEDKALALADKVDKDIKSAKKEETENTIGEIFTKYWWVLAIIILYFALNQKGKAPATA